MRLTIKLFAIVFLILINHIELKAQVLDSLLSELYSVESDTARITKSSSLLSSISQINPDTAIFVSVKLYEESKKVVPNIYKAEAALNVGRIYMRSGGYGKSLAYLNEANTIEFNALEYPILKGEILRGIGNIYFIQYRPDESMQYYREALEYFEQAQSEYYQGIIYGGIASIYYEDGRYDSSLYYNLKKLETLQESGSEMDKGRSYVNIGMLYDAMDSTEKAIDYSLEVLKIADRNNALLMKTYPLKVLSSVYRKQGDFRRALEFAEESLALSQKLNIIYEMKDAHSNLARTNYEMGNYKEAYDHLLNQKMLNDSLLNEDANVRLAEMRAKYETEKAEQENEILASKSALQKTRFAAISSSLVLGLVFVTFFYSRNVAKKSRELEIAEKDKLISDSKRKIVEKELQNAEMKTQHLQNELSNYALHIVEKNNFLEEVKAEMVEVRSEIKNDDALKQINKLGSKIYQNLMINKDREEFDIQVEQACEGFFKKLDIKYPNLTNQERRLSALLRLNLTSKDISGILNISPKSVDQTRYRLRKKLNIDKSKNLSSVLNQI